MELVMLLFFLLIAAAAAFGVIADSRDGADWRPSADGDRVARWQ